MAALKERCAYKTATLRRGRFAFNQVAYEHQTVTPERVILIGWDAGRGVHIWTPSGDQAARHATTQASGYSVFLPNIDPDAPPEWLGPPAFITRESMAEAGVWPEVSGLAPHRKRQTILHAVSVVRPNLFA